MPALRELVVAFADSKFLARSKLVSSRPSLSSGMTIVAFSLQTHIRSTLICSTHWTVLKNQRNYPDLIRCSKAFFSLERAVRYFCSSVEPP